MKVNPSSMSSLKVGEINSNIWKEVVWDIIMGKKTKFKPKVWITQYRIGLNDREKTINAIIDD